MTVPVPAEPLRRQLFLVLHDPFTGRPVIRPSAVGCGLITSVIAELVLEGRARTADEVTPRLLAETVLGATPPPARADELPGLVQRTVVGGLIADGVVREQAGRSLLGRAQPRYPAVDLVRAVRPRRRLERALASRRPLTAREAVLVALLDALGAGHALELDGGAVALRARAGAAVDGLPAAVRALLVGLAHSDGGAPLLRR